jgi:AcrR family transcriptional regulator
MGSQLAKSARSNTLSVRDELAALKRERILDAATHLFGERGYHGTSMEAIADALGATKPFVYYQFQDKADLLTAICSKGADLSLEAARSAVASGLDPAESFRAFCLALAKIVIAYGPYVSVYAREMNNLPTQARRTIEKKRAEIDRLAATMIAEGAKRGLFDCEDALLQARAITGMISYMHMWHRDRAGVDQDQLAQQITMIAMRTLVTSRLDQPA